VLLLLTVSGLRNRGWFSALNISARNSRILVSSMFVLFAMLNPDRFVKVPEFRSGRSFHTFAGKDC